MLTILFHVHRSPTKKQKPTIVNAKFPNDFFGTNRGIEVRSRQMSQRKPAQAIKLFKKPDTAEQQHELSYAY